MRNGRLPASWVDALLIRMGPRGVHYRRGWGDDDGYAALRAGVQPTAPPTIEVHSRRTKTRGVPRSFAGTFVSPAAGLPSASREVRIDLWLPHLAPRAIAVLPPALGEGTRRRREWLARPLLRAGIGSLFVDLPGFAPRGPSTLPTVSYFASMVLAGAVELCGLAEWLFRRGERPVLVGYSLGGIVAAYATIRTPRPLDLVCASTPTDWAPAMTDGALAPLIAWSALGDAAQARWRMRALNRPVALTRLPPPIAPERAWLIGCRADRVVPATDVRALAEHWRGCTLRWLPCGHAVGAMLSVAAVRRVLRAIAKGDAP